MKLSLAMLVVLAAAVGRAAPAAAQLSAETIYGEDGRIDLYQTRNPLLRALASSTVALFRAGSVKTQDAVAVLATAPYGQSMGLCKDEPFYDQVNGAFCSGSLVAPDIIMTAGHCVKNAQACASTKFVFDFAVKRENEMPTSMDARNVYGCRQLLARQQNGEGADFALVRLDRPVLDRTPLWLGSPNDLANGTPLVVIGHPSGLPTKIAGGAQVRNASPDGYFVANLDTYGGNSGSAVFDERTMRIAGVLVRGDDDFVQSPDGCFTSHRCPADGCRGEDVTKISAVLPPLLLALQQEREERMSASVAGTAASLTAESHP